MQEFTDQQLTIIFILLIWSMIWKYFALWKSARENERGWFTAFVVLNTLGILEIIYLCFIKQGQTKHEK
ncbi:MAG: DUF5652 family protein [Patescibacteria group bacterium]